MKWTASKHVSMNRWTNFYNIFYMKNSVWIFLNSFVLLFYEEGGKLEKSRLVFQKKRKISISKLFSKIDFQVVNFRKKFKRWTGKKPTNLSNLIIRRQTEKILGYFLFDTNRGFFSFSPHLQIFTSKFVDHIVRLLWKFTYRLIRPRQPYLVFILNLVKPLVTLISWKWRQVGGKGKRAQTGTMKMRVKCNRFFCWFIWSFCILS